MKQKIRQIIYDMRHQPLVSSVTFIATAMSMFLFMIIAITTQIKVIPFSPESCRNRLLVGKFVHIVSINDNINSSGGLTDATARILYDELDGVEHTSYFNMDFEVLQVKDISGLTFSARTKQVDAEFFQIFDHPLLNGRYFTTDEVNANMPLAIICESVARQAFGTIDCTGQEISIKHKKFTVVGVIRNNSILASTGFGEIFVGYNKLDNPADVSPYNFGSTSVALLVKEGIDFEYIRKQVKARYAILDTKLQSFDCKTIYHEAPFDQEIIAGGIDGSNVTPDKSNQTLLRYAIYAILLIVPAINLASMLQSRMRKRISEIGIRRAFGCTRFQIMTNIIGENFIVTLIGGIVGLILGIVFALTYSGLYENMDNYGANITPAISAVINWSTVFIALLACFILNIISAIIPAWQASRVNPVDAINAK